MGWILARCRFGIVVRLALMLVGSIGTALQTGPIVRAQVSTSQFTGDGLTFRYPASWHLYYRSTPLTLYSSLIAHFSSSPLDDPCSSSLYLCGHPESKLAPRGMLVTWTENGFPGWTLAQASGRSLTISGQPAKLRIEKGVGAPVGCPAGTTEAITADITALAAYNWYGVRACIRGPNVQSVQRQVLRMVRSVSLVK